MRNQKNKCSVYLLDLIEKIENGLLPWIHYKQVCWAYFLPAPIVCKSTQQLSYRVLSKAVQQSNELEAVIIFQNKRFETHSDAIQIIVLQFKISLNL